MGDLIFVVVTVAFFLVASSYVTLCNRILGSDTSSPTESLSREIPTIGAGESAGAVVTEQKGVSAQ